MKIEIRQEGASILTNPSLLEYESDISPLIGDIYAGMNFKDTYQRTIVKRMLLPTVPNWIIVYVVYSFPNLVKMLNGKEELSEIESDLLVSNNVS